MLENSSRIPLGVPTVYEFHYLVGVPTVLYMYTYVLDTVLTLHLTNIVLN
jgi:hypothetical protein